MLGLSGDCSALYCDFESVMHLHHCAFPTWCVISDVFCCRREGNYALFCLSLWTASWDLQKTGKVCL